MTKQELLKLVNALDPKGEFLALIIPHTDVAEAFVKDRANAHEFEDDARELCRHTTLPMDMSPNAAIEEAVNEELYKDTRTAPPA